MYCFNNYFFFFIAFVVINYFIELTACYSVSCLMPGNSIKYIFSPSQVGIGTNNTLYALEDGVVRFTKEVYIPRPRNPEARDTIPKLPKGAILYKSFISVVPTKQENKFKLVDLV